MTIDQINIKLFSLSKTNLITYSSKVIPNCKPIIGVKVPDLRILGKQIAKEGYEEFLNDCPDDYYEQQMLQAMVIGYAKDDIEKILKHADGFIPKIQDWAVNDCFCQTFRIARENRAKVWEWLQKYANSDKEYDQRVVAVLLMSHFLTEEYIEVVLALMDRLQNPAYYTKMGIAWCIATAYAKFPDETKKYLQKNHLDNWTYNKSIQKMLESFRVSDEDKKMLRSMKRK